MKTIVILAVSLLLAATVAAQIENPQVIRINHVENIEAGEAFWMSVEHVSGTESVGGFDMIIALGHRAVSIRQAVPGSVFDVCDWEYFTYRYETANIPAVRVVGIAETNNGSVHPSCFSVAAHATLFELELIVDSTAYLNCARIPAQFVWLDCGDNIVSSRYGDTLFAASSVHDPYLVETPPPDTFPSYNGIPDQCLEVDRRVVVRAIEYHNGWIEMKCDRDAPMPGDVNLNDTPYEIGDAVLMSNYFVRGASVLTKDVERQIQAGDCNLDGIAMTVADLIYCILVVIGDAEPYPTSIVPDSIEIDPTVTIETQSAKQ